MNNNNKQQNCSLPAARCPLLAIDSATSILSVAVSKEGEIFEREASSEEARTSESAMTIIDSLIKEAELKPSDLNGVVCVKGPGSFTGLRIGYSIAKGLALSLSIPFIALPALMEIKKENGGYFYCVNGKIEKRGFARELIEAAKDMDFKDDSALFTGPEY